MTQRTGEAVPEDRRREGGEDVIDGKGPMPDPSVTEAIIGAAMEVHRTLGPGLLESAYRKCLARGLYLRGVPFREELELPVEYKGMTVDSGYRIDLLVADQVVLELKVVETVMPVHEAQLLTYLRLSGHRVGLLINFHVPVLRRGIRRRVL